jgi:hypothetical protein
MARYAFGFESTLDSNHVLAKMARVLADDGHKVYVITGSSKDIKDDLDKLDIKYHKIIKVKGNTHREIGEAKGHAANTHGISVFFSGNPEIITGFAATSRISRCLMPGKKLMQPETKKRECPCEGEPVSDWIAVRCWHCTETIETPEMRVQHRELHHG